MPVSDFECQIARGQIGRYLGGGMLSPEAMIGLEGHLAECGGCKSLVAERRAALLASLGGEAPARAVVEMPVENPLIAALRAKAAADTAPEAPKPAPSAKPAPRYAKVKSKPQGNLGKPLALAALLAVVLVGMSRLSHTATAPSARADASFAAETLPNPPVPQKVEEPKAAVSAVRVKVVEASKTKIAPVQASLAPHPLPPLPRKGEGIPVAAPWRQVGAPNPDVAETAPKRAYGNPLGPSRPAALGFPQSRGDAKGARASSRAESGSKLPHSQRGLRPKHLADRFAARAIRPSTPRRRTPSATRRSQKGPRNTVRVYGLDGHPLKP